MSPSEGRIPSSLELRCLKQMDNLAVWNRIKKEYPAPQERLPRRVFTMIFWFNVQILFGVTLAIFIVVQIGLESSLAEMFDLSNVAVTVGFAAVLSLIVGAFAAGLYRRSWNHRARALVDGTAGDYPPLP